MSCTLRPACELSGTTCCDSGELFNVFCSCIASGVWYYDQVLYCKLECKVLDTLESVLNPNFCDITYEMTSLLSFNRCRRLTQLPLQLPKQIEQNNYDNSKRGDGGGIRVHCLQHRTRLRHSHDPRQRRNCFIAREKWRLPAAQDVESNERGAPSICH